MSDARAHMREQPSAMTCSECGQHNVKTIDSRQRPSHTWADGFHRPEHIWRRRQCDDCGNRFTTREFAEWPEPVR